MSSEIGIRKFRPSEFIPCNLEEQFNDHFTHIKLLECYLNAILDACSSLFRSTDAFGKSYYQIGNAITDISRRKHYLGESINSNSNNNNSDILNVTKCTAFERKIDYFTQIMKELQTSNHEQVQIH